MIQLSTVEGLYNLCNNEVKFEQTFGLGDTSVCRTSYSLRSPFNFVLSLQTNCDQSWEVRADSWMSVFRSDKQSEGGRREVDEGTWGMQRRRSLAYITLRQSLGPWDRASLSPAPSLSPVLGRVFLLPGKVRIDLLNFTSAPAPSPPSRLLFP